MKTFTTNKINPGDKVYWRQKIKHQIKTISATVHSIDGIMAIVRLKSDNRLISKQVDLLTKKKKQ